MSSIKLIRTAYPEHDDVIQRRIFEEKLKKEKLTPEEKVKQIFDEINIDIDLEEIMKR